MSNEGIQQSVIKEVKELAWKLYAKITGNDSDIINREDGILSCEPGIQEDGKQVIGFGFFVYHEDGSIATDAIGYWDRHRVQARMTNFLQKLSFAQEAQVSDVIFYPVDEKTGERLHTQPLTNEQARPQLWKGF